MGSGYETATWARVFSYMSVMTHSSHLRKGVIDLKDAIFYVNRDFPGTIFHGPFHGIAAVEVVMASQWLKARQTKYAAYAAIYILVVIAVVVVVNVLADRYNKSYDATANKRYSLSEQTAKIVKGLKQDATITYFNQSTRFRRGQGFARRVPEALSQGEGRSMLIRRRIRIRARGAGNS